MITEEHLWNTLRILYSKRFRDFERSYPGWSRIAVESTFGVMNGFRFLITLVDDLSRSTMSNRIVAEKNKSLVKETYLCVLIIDIPSTNLNSYRTGYLILLLIFMFIQIQAIEIDCMCCKAEKCTLTIGTLVIYPPYHMKRQW